MKSINLINVYYSIPTHCLPSILKRPIDKILEIIFSFLANRYLSKPYKNKISKKDCGPILKKQTLKIIVSLTSIPSRISTASISIQSILNQTVQPDKVILWLAYEQFPDGLEGLPYIIKQLQKNGLTIMFCEDLKSHKKYHYTLKLFPESDVILIDDDIFYPKNLIEELLKGRDRYPNCIIASRAHLMSYKSDGSLLPYRKWQHNAKMQVPSHFMMHTSGNGTLIPAAVKFDKIFYEKEVFMKLTPNSDDVWFKANLLRMDIKVYTIQKFKKDPITLKGSYSTSLVSQNTHLGKKDDQLHRVFDFFNLGFTESYILNIDKH